MIIFIYQRISRGKNDTTSVS